jgi:hypothetical protein
MIFGPIRENPTVRKTALFATLCLALSTAVFAAPQTTTPAPSTSPAPTKPATTTTKKKTTHHRRHHKKHTTATPTPTPSR